MKTLALPQSDRNADWIKLSYPLRTKEDRAASTRPKVTPRVAFAFNPNQPRYPKGHPRGGQFMPMHERDLATKRPGETDKEQRKRVKEGLAAPDQLPTDPSLFFDESLATGEVVRVKVADLATTRARPDGIENAEKLMDAAAKGIIPKRAPLKLRRNPDGSFIVLDGNSTTAIAQKHGIEELVGEVVDVPHDIAIQRAVIRVIEEQRGEVFDQYKEWIENTGIEGVEPILGPIKEPGRATKKIAKKVAKAAAAGALPDNLDDFVRDNLHDVVRGTLVIDDVRDKERVVKAVAEKWGAANIEIEDRFDKPTPAGYSDVQLKISPRSGVKTELQIQIPEMLAAKEGPEPYLPESVNKHKFALVGHDLYKEEREIPEPTPRKTKLEAQMIDLYLRARVRHARRHGLALATANAQNSGSSMVRLSGSSVSGSSISTNWSRLGLKTSARRSGVIATPATPSSTKTVPPGSGKRAFAMTDPTIASASDQARKMRVDEIADNTLEMVSGVAAQWLGGVRPFFIDLMEKAAAETVTDADFIAALDAAKDQLPELFDHLDTEALLEAFETSGGVALLAGSTAFLDPKA